MRIAIIGASTFDTLEYHIADSLIFLNHEVKIFDFKTIIPFKQLKKYEVVLRKLSDKYILFSSKDLVEDILTFKPDLVIATYRDIHPNCINEIKKKLIDVPVVHLNPDQMTTLEHQQIFASNYDFYFSKDKYSVAFMKDKLDLNAFYLPECYNQRVCISDFSTKIEAEEKINIDVLVYGTFYPYRNRMVDFLLKKGLNLKLCGHKGHYFPRHFDSYFMHPIFGREKSNFIYGSKIVLNNLHFAEIKSVNEKYFVINGTGGFQICDYKDEISELSLCKSEVFTFRTVDEAYEKICYFLENAALRLAIAQEEKKHFEKYHTYDVRMEQLLKVIF